MERKPFYLFTAACAFVLVTLYVIALSDNFTGDSGDSIAHYLYAHYVYKHPAFFLNLWAKPLYVLIASPFAQFGFAGIKLFNCTLAVATCFVTFLIARELKLTHSFLVLPFMFFCPLYFMLAFSGLTEYLFAFVFCTAIYLVFKRKLTASFLLVSLLPFIRSEGLIIICVFAVYIVSIKQYKLLPLLLAGHVIYSLAGLFYYHNLLWVFTRLPNASMGSGYGHGGPFDFVYILLYVIEKPVFLLLAAGMISLFIYIIKQKNVTSSKEETILIYGSFIVFFCAHSFFWWKGIFNSGGFLMPRVLIPMVPLIAIISLRGLNFITGLLQKSAHKNIVVALFTCIIICFPFTPRSKGIVYNKELFILPDEVLVDNNIAPFLIKSIPDYTNFKIYTAEPYLSIPLHVDPFDSAHYSILNYSLLQNIPSKSIIVWDNWYSPHEGGVPIDKLTSDKSMVQLGSFTEYDKAKEIRFTVFRKD